MVDIANSFIKSNINTTLVYGRLVERNVKLSLEANRIKISKYKRNSTFSKLLSWVLASIQIFWLCFFRFRKHEIYFFSNPPTSVFISLFIKINYNIVIFDVYPDVLVQSKLLSQNSFLIKFWQKLNRKVFSNANRVITISNSMVDSLTKYIDRSKIEVIPIWGSNVQVNKIAFSENRFLTKYALSEKFIVLYAGNLGSTHDLMVIPKLAQLVDEEKVLFIIVGDGPQKEKLVKYHRDNSIENIFFLPYQTQEMLPHMFGAAEVAIIPFSTHLSSMSIPSKTFDYMSFGIPLLVIGDSDTELGKLVVNYKNGKVFSGQNLQVVANYITSLAANKLELNLQKENSYKAATYFSKELAYNYQ
jgi:glycosyltransferase involved in cell wall biosynthesis